MIQTTAISGGVLLDGRGNTVLVEQRNSRNGWSFPKGHVEPGESLVSAARREILEETGLAAITLLRALGCYERPAGDESGELKQIHLFAFSVDAVAQQLRGDARWVALVDVEHYLATADFEFVVAVCDLVGQPADPMPHDG